MGKRPYFDSNICVLFICMIHNLFSDVLYKIVMTSSSKCEPIVKPPARKRIKAVLSSLWVIIGFCSMTFESFPQTKFFISYENFVIVPLVPDLLFRFISLSNI